MISTIHLLLLAIVRKRLLLIGSAVVAILFVGLVQTGANGIAEGQLDYGKRTLHVMDYGYALPIEVTAIRNFHRAHWVRDLELELRNVSTKPIYEIYFTLFMPDDKGKGGNPCAVSLEYGRLDLIHPRQRPTADDKPIWPGETAVVKVKERLSRGYEQHLKQDNVKTISTYKVRMAILAINFGDGTGFINGGVPYPGNPDAPKPQSRYVRIPIESNQQPLQFRIVGRPPINSGSPGDLATTSVHTLDVCCPSHCDGNYSNNPSKSYCNPQGLPDTGCNFPGSMARAPSLGVFAISLDYKESRHTDQYGNQFRYRGKVYDQHNAHLGRWAWDVFFVTPSGK